MATPILDLQKQNYLHASEDSPDHEQMLRKATVALLTDVARADCGTSDEERRAVPQVIECYFAVSAGWAVEIAEAAGNHVEERHQCIQ